MPISTAGPRPTFDPAGIGAELADRAEELITVIDSVSDSIHGGIFGILSTLLCIVIGVSAIDLGMTAD